MMAKNALPRPTPRVFLGEFGRRAALPAPLDRTAQEPPENLRPGLSATAKVTTATKNNALSVPIQAVTVRRPADLQSVSEKLESKVPGVRKENAKDAKTDIQGVFVIRNRKAEFVPVQTGITGSNDIEVLNGLNEGDEIITGSYKVLRTLRPRTSVKVDNSKPSAPEDNS